MALPNGVEGTERIIVKRRTVERGAADVFDAIPSEFKETISEVHFADGELNVGQIGAYGIDVDEEWLARIAGSAEFERPSNLIEVVRISQLGRGLRWQDEPESRDAATQEIEDFDVDPLEPYLADAPPFPEIVDPDTGTGQYRYYRLGPVLDQGREGACKVAGTLIRMADGTTKPIEEIRLGERVVTAEGRTGRVMTLYARETDEGLVHAGLVGHNNLKATPNHPILTKRGYVAIRDLRKGDEVALVRYLPESVDTLVVDEIVSFAESRGTKHGLVMAGGVLTQVDAPPKTLPLTRAFGRLIGLYLAEGGTTSNRVTWTFGAHEEDTLVKETCDLIRSVLGAEPRVQYRRPDGKRVKSINVVLYGKLWRLLFERIAGKGAAEKGLSEKLAAGPRRFLKAVFSGWIAGDGHDDGDTTEGATVSHRLALDMYNIAQALGLRPTISRRQPILNKHAGTRREFWLVAVRNNPTDRMCSQDSKHVWRKVREVIFEPFAGVVYNLHVEGDESYVAEGVGVHNCTGFCGANFLNCGPMMVRPFLTDEQALEFYYRNRQIDEWPGEAYSGSSVTAMCKQLIELGRITKWAVTSSFEEMVRWKLAGAVSGAGGTLMLSTPWYEGMYVTDATGYIRPTGRKVGGHAILDRGVSQWRSGSWFNSWGGDFGNGGVGSVSEADYRWLISQGLRAYCAIQTA